MCRQREGGRLNWWAMTDACKHIRKFLWHIGFHFGIIEGNTITCSIAKQSAEQHQKNNNVQNYWIKETLSVYVGYTGGDIRVSFEQLTFEQQGLSVSSGRCWLLNIHRPCPANHNLLEIHEKQPEGYQGSLWVKDLVLHFYTWTSTLIRGNFLWCK